MLVGNPLGLDKSDVSNPPDMSTNFTHALWIYKSCPISSGYVSSLIGIKAEQRH